MSSNLEEEINLVSGSRRIKVRGIVKNSSFFYRPGRFSLGFNQAWSVSNDISLGRAFFILEKTGPFLLVFILSNPQD